MTSIDTLFVGPPATQSCVACREQILKDATVCKTCKSDQARWRNELRYWAGVAGILTLVASGIAFTASVGFQLWQRLFGHEVTVTNIDPFGETVIWNLTGNPIEIKTISIFSAAPKTDLVWEVHKTIPANAKDQVSLLDVASKSWYDLPGEMFGKAPAGYAKVEPAEFEQLRQSMFTDKYVPTFLMPESASYAQLKKELGTGFQSFDCTISIGFTRLLDGTSSSIGLPCKGVFRYRKA
jgi:hypothetical protein